MGNSYQGADILFFCRERPRIVAYCRGLLRPGLTAWAHHHIARCPECFQTAMRTLDAVEKGLAGPLSPAQTRVIEAEWRLVPAERPDRLISPLSRPRARISLMKWMLAGLFTLSFAGLITLMLFAVAIQYRR